MCGNVLSLAVFKTEIEMFTFNLKAVFEAMDHLKKGFLFEDLAKPKRSLSITKIHQMS